MKIILHIVVLLIGASIGYSSDLALRLVSNASGIHWSARNGLTEVLKIQVYVENTASHDLMIVTSPKRVLNWDSFKAIYWYDLEGLGGKVVAPNPYKLKPIRVPAGDLALIDELEIPVAEISTKLLSKEGLAFIASYEIDSAILPYLSVWTGKVTSELRIR